MLTIYQLKISPKNLPKELVYIGSPRCEFSSMLKFYYQEEKISLALEKQTSNELLEKSRKKFCKGQFEKAKEYAENREYNSQVRQLANVYKKYSEKLSSNSYWTKLKKNINELQISDLNKLQAKWPAYFSHYTCDELLFKARCLDKIIAIINKAEIDFLEIKYRCPEEFNKDYSEYINNIKQAIVYENEKIMYSMLYRMKLADEHGNLKFSDLISDCVNKIELITGYSDLKLNPKYIRQDFSSESFLYYFRYLIFHLPENDRQLKALFSLKWLRNKTDPIQLVGPEGQLFFIPTCLLSYFSDLSKVTWYQYQKKFCIDYIQKQFQLLAMVRLHRTVDEPIIVINHDIGFSCIEIVQLGIFYEHIVNAIDITRASYMTGFWSLFYRTTNDFLKTWEHYLKHVKENIVRRKILIFKVAVNQLIDDASLLDAARIDIDKFYHELLELVSSLDNKEMENELHKIDSQWLCLINKPIVKDKKRISECEQSKQLVCENHYLFFSLTNTSNTQHEIINDIGDQWDMQLKEVENLYNGIKNE